MFGARFGGGGRRSGRDGPVAIPKGERLELRPIRPPPPPPTTEAESEDVPNSLLTLANSATVDENTKATAAAAIAANSKETLAEALPTKEIPPPPATTTAIATPIGTTGTSLSRIAEDATPKSNSSQVGESSSPSEDGVEEDEINRQEEGESKADEEDDEAEEEEEEGPGKKKKEKKKKKQQQKSNGSLDEDMSRKVSELIAKSPNAANEAASCYGQPLEYAAGFALRKNILDPLKSDISDLEEGEISSKLGNYSRGQQLLLGANNEIRHCSVKRIIHDDGITLAMWWDGDKYLSYTNEEWSDWWIRRCHLFDPGCEMVKIVNEKDETLGVAYYERNIVDKYLFEGDMRGRVTLIRGIRLEPSLNPEAVRRSNISGTKPSYEVKYRGIASLLLCHILFTSIRYGSHGVAVNCPKNEVAEKFYESFMGPPLFCEEETGRRYYRMTADKRWQTLQEAFLRQIKLWKEDSKTLQKSAAQPESSNQKGKTGGSQTSKRNREAGRKVADDEDTGNQPAKRSKPEEESQLESETAKAGAKNKDHDDDDDDDDDTDDDQS